MTYSTVLVEDIKPVRNSRILPRCIVATLLFGLVLYGVYSVIRIPSRGIIFTESGNTPCDCYPQPYLAATLDHQRVFYNRVPKCGSTSMITLMRRLAVRNNFKHLNSKVYDRKIIDEQEQCRLVRLIKNTPDPCSFDRHVFFINFTKFEENPPMYINVIREPVERIISSYFYRRMVARQNRTRLKPGDYWLNKKFEHCVLSGDPECTFLEGESYNVLQLPYFCGQEEDCQLLNDETALQRAKQNIDKYYAVVGTLEKMNDTLQVLEAVLPQFFNGALHTYHNLGVHRNQNVYKEHVREDIKAQLRRNLTGEYELYHFVRQRLHTQYQSYVEKQSYEYRSASVASNEISEYK